MHYISIGWACSAKYQIDKHKGKKHSLFFDTLMTDMETVINILKCDDISKIVNFDNIIRDPNNPFTDDHSRIIFKSLSLCISIHDINKEYDDNDMLNFINKYIRRFNRIIEYIKSEEKIYFLRYGNINNSHIQLFIETIFKINPNCKFALIVIDPSQNINSLIKYDNCLIINLIEDKLNADWTKSHLDWAQIFIDIENTI